jgi:hypothetical protein
MKKLIVKDMAQLSHLLERNVPVQIHQQGSWQNEDLSFRTYCEVVSMVKNGSIRITPPVATLPMIALVMTDKGSATIKYDGSAAENYDDFHIDIENFDNSRVIWAALYLVRNGTLITNYWNTGEE